MISSDENTNKVINTDILQPETSNKINSNFDLNTILDKLDEYKYNNLSKEFIIKYKENKILEIAYIHGKGLQKHALILIKVDKLPGTIKIEKVTTNILGINKISYDEKRELSQKKEYDKYYDNDFYKNNLMLIDVIYVFSKLEDKHTGLVIIKYEQYDLVIEKEKELIKKTIEEMKESDYVFKLSNCYTVCIEILDKLVKNNTRIKTYLGNHLSHYFKYEYESYLVKCKFDIRNKKRFII